MPRARRLRRQAARPPKTLPARANTHMVMVTAYSLVVIICIPHGTAMPNTPYGRLLWQPVAGSGKLDIGRIRAAWW